MATLSPLPTKLEHLLAQTPPKGQRNVWFFHVAACARFVASPAKVKRVLRACVEAYKWDDRDFDAEIDRAVDRAFAGRLTPAATLPSITWPQVDTTKRNSLAIQFRNAVPYDPLGPGIATPPAKIVRSLYRPNELVCTSRGADHPATQPIETTLPHVPHLEFIVANPMTARTGINQDGHVSTRCLGNACFPTDRRWLVVEFDKGSFEFQAALLQALHHPDLHPLSLVVHSGNKSLHGWFHVRAITGRNQYRFFRAAARLGADTSLWDPSKLVRMPGGRRSTGQPQRILYADTARILGCYR